MGDFRDGLTFWWRGWGHIFNHRRLQALALLPLLISLGFTVGFLWLMVTHLGLWVHQLVAAVIGMSTGGLWYSLVYYPLLVGGGLIVFLSALYVTFLLHACLAVPFYSLLAEQTLLLRGHRSQRTWRVTLRMFRISLVKAMILLIIGLFLFVFSFVPLLNVVAMAAALLLMAFDCMDYSFDCLGFGASRRLGYLWRERAQWLGMALGLALTLLLPGLTLLVTPGAVVGSALLVKEQE